MKKLIYCLAVAALMAGISSCAGSRQVSHARATAAHFYGRSPLMNSYSNVHQRPPID